MECAYYFDFCWPLYLLPFLFGAVNPFVDRQTRENERRFPGIRFEPCLASRPAALWGDGLYLDFSTYFRGVTSAMSCAFSLSNGNCISLAEASKSISLRSTFRTRRLC